MARHQSRSSTRTHGHSHRNRADQLIFCRKWILQIRSTSGSISRTTITLYRKRSCSFYGQPLLAPTTHFPVLFPHQSEFIRRHEPRQHHFQHPRPERSTCRQKSSCQPGQYSEGERTIHIQQIKINKSIKIGSQWLFIAQTIHRRRSTQSIRLLFDGSVAHPYR